MNNIAGLPDEVFSLLTATDARHGFPPGTMAAILQQEVGGQLDRFLGDPSAYHFDLNAQGRRVAPHTGEVSTAFGPFGILDSTARDPGWGVQPLQDKTSLDDQVRFAGDYLAARIRQSGDFAKGIANYGEGDRYASNVLSRIPGFPQESTNVAIAAPMPTEEVTPEVPQIAVMQPTETNPNIPPEWEQFRGWVPRREPNTRAPAQSQPLTSGIRAPDFSQTLGMAQSMMAQNQATLQQGWNAMRGWL